MLFISVDQAVQVEQAKFLAHTNTMPQDYPYVGAANAAIARGELAGGALHLSSLVRLNADLNRLRTTAPEAFDHYVTRWREITRGFPESARRNAALVRGWRVELLTAAELAAAGVPFFIGDPNPREAQRQPDLLAHHAGAQLFVECGSVEPDDDARLADRVFTAAWKKAFDKPAERLYDYVGPNALLVLDITSVAARYAAQSEGNAALDVFSRSIARSLTRIMHEA